MGIHCSSRNTKAFWKLRTRHLNLPHCDYENLLEELHKKLVVLPAQKSRGEMTQSNFCKDRDLLHCLKQVENTASTITAYD
jgi:hypothetical protein